MLYIVRHGQTDWNLGNRIQGIADVPLNETGRIHAHNVAQKLQNLKIQKIVSSNLSRAAETAQIIGNTLNITVEYDARLREYDFGELTGLCRAGIEPQMIEMFFAAPTKFGAEQFQHAFTRVARFLQYIDYKQNTLAVTHGGVINFVLCYLEDKNNFYPHTYLSKCLNVHIDNSAVLRIKDLKSGISILKNTRFHCLSK